MCLAQGPQRSDAGEARTHGPSVLSQGLYHWATALPLLYLWVNQGTYDNFYLFVLLLLKYNTICNDMERTRIYIIILLLFNFRMKYLLSYDVASGSEIKPCIKIDKPLVVYRFSGNVMKWRF